MKKLFLSAALLLFLFANGHAAVAPTTALSASTFINSMGVNTHIIYKDGAYANAASVVQDLNYIGVYHVRDSAPTSWNPGTASLGDYVTWANAGIYFDLLGAQIASDGSSVDLTMINAIAGSIQNNILSIEGPNEINNWPVGPYDGLPAGTAAAIAFMGDLYTAVHSDPALIPGILVYDMTGAPSVSSLAARADVANTHPYPSNGQQPYDFVEGAFAGYTMSRPFPEVITEIGNFSLPPGWLAGTPWWEGYTELGIDEPTQAKSIINSYFDGALFGVGRTYIYELLDEKADPTMTLPEFHFGMFRFDTLTQPAASAHMPKASAIAIHNLTTLLNANGATPVNSFAQRQLSYSVENMPSTGSSLLLQRADGTFILALWNNVPFWYWDSIISMPVNSTPIQVMLQLQQQASSIQVFDPLVGITPITSQQNIQGMTLNVPDHPILVTITLGSKR